jgi:tetratricopeptide (TPR) repeat protein
MPRRIRRSQQHRARDVLCGPELAQTFYDLAQFHDRNGRAAEAVSHYASALQMDLDPALRPYCRAYLAENLYRTRRVEEARRRAAGALADTSDPELTSLLTRLLDNIERGIDSL